MISYINVHSVLDGRRNRAKALPSDSDTSQLMNEEAIPIASQAGFALPFSRRQKALESTGALSANRR
ncbi:hypothetical protein HAX54_039576 [Datura stramonium]|uniref:Uncharacterized protein n=1 Tax=Datura stramonium TaxID=4076 RepID=A0ABS8SK60_DATST|nr:hypothetical protein [Datura stramonium]